MSEVYGVIAEFKNQAPIIMEMEFPEEERAYERMSELLKMQHCIRAAVFKAVYAGGNRSLLPTDTTQGE